MSRVWVYPEREWRNLGESCWCVTWDELKPGVVINGDVDPDSDIVQKVYRTNTEDKAVAYANHILKTDKPFFGVATVQKQVVDWFVQEDRIAEWCDAGPSQEIS